ncbi:MAG: hypothetical protein CMH48_07675 [Muricauda sp.]|nr:hypothetical protein [Allomuricauda sp.]MBC30711.1 hypothetical protein [Allomuricauda sp.]
MSQTHPKTIGFLNLRLLQVLLLFFSISFGGVHAQLEASIWYFGYNAGLDFRSGTPVALTDGALYTREGCATISDATGNLLFYTDGITAWDRNHDVMPNGNFLGGDTSSTQSAIIVPNPGNPNLFYIFTTPATFIVGDPGLRYSEVDMTLNGGLGDINATKNVLIHAPVPEKITAIEHANGSDIWVVTHHWGNDAFAAYRVTAAGLNTTAVISNVGFDMDYRTIGDDTYLSKGAIKISPDGTRLAIAHSLIGVEVFDFDTATGQVSNAIRLKEGTEEYYGVEFSPNSEVLYLSIEAGGIFQYNLNAADISASEIELGNNTTMGGLQLGIDGKLYVAMMNSPFLGAVNQPNVVGTGCDFEPQAVSLGTELSFLGLPPFIQSYFFIDDIQAENLCFGDATEFSINVSEPIVSINWNFGDGNTSTMESPTHTYLSAGTYTVSVTVSTASGIETKISDITISEVPIANAPSLFEVCENETQIPYEFDLGSKDTEVLGTQDPAVFSVSYFATRQDADDFTNELTGLQSLGYGTTTFYARVNNVANSLCYDITSFDALVKQLPIPSAIPNTITVCDDDEDRQYPFDLATMRSNLLVNENPVFSEVSFHVSQADADNAVNPLPDTYTNTQPVETIIFRMQNQTYPECYETGEVTLEVIGQVIANTPSDLSHCDDNNDGQAYFDLTKTEAEIIGVQNPSSLIITFHKSQADADTGTNAVDASDYFSTSYQNTIYVRVENASDSSCYETTSFGLLIYDTPTAPTVTDWQVCDDDNDGEHSFDLTQKNMEILGGNAQWVLTYHGSQDDAETGQNAITGVYQNTGNPQAIYFRLENQGNAQCSAVGSFALQVFDTPTAYRPTDIVVCDVDETGSYTFDLSQKDSEVLNGQDPAVYEVSYHPTELDAFNNDSPLSKTNHVNSVPTETIFVKVRHSEMDECYDVSQFAIIINPLPELVLDGTYVICPDHPELVIDGGSFETYEWRDEMGSIIGTQQIVSINGLGTYSLTVTQTINGVICENTATFEVVSSGAPDSFTVSTSGLSDTVVLTIDAVGIGDFEYSIDGIAYQTNNRFEVFPGEYTVYVRDPFECRVLTQEVVAMGYQRFFTPNGDGVNEYWNIIGAPLFPESMLYIYDRYGKLMGHVSPQSLGWDGTYQGQPMPSADYWFRYEYDQGKVYTGHFSLKR